MATISVRRPLAALLAAAFMAAGLVAVMDARPAEAAAACTSMTPSTSVGTVYNGAIRRTDIGEISWSFWKSEPCTKRFPPGGILYVRANRLNTAPTTCYTSVAQYGSWWRYTDYQKAQLLNPGTGWCFRTQYYAGNLASAGYRHDGRLVY